MPVTADDFLWLSPRIKLLPVIHGSGDFAMLVRDEMLARRWDCVAVPLPPSFQSPVEEAIRQLPTVSLVAMEEPEPFDLAGPVEDDADEASYSYVPTEPCQPAIRALSIADQEGIAREFIDLETERFESYPCVLPDPYALKRMSLPKFAAAVLPAIPPPQSRQHSERLRWMAARLRELERDYESILCVCSFLDWPWLRDAYRRQLPEPEHAQFYAPVRTYRVREPNLIFVLGELPYLTHLYARSQRELRPDENLSVDGVKELVVEARDRWLREEEQRARQITPQLLSRYFHYVRNLTLMDRRLTPDLYTLLLGAKQVFGDGFALKIAEVAREYPYQGEGSPGDEIAVGLDQAELPEGGVVTIKNRLPGLAVTWRTLELKPPPKKCQLERWRQRWNPFGQCSWPPEDDHIESFHTHVRDQAKALMGADLARSEKFTTSIRDGLDMRETLRNWQTGDIYVKVIPPSRGNIEVVVFLFDTPADPEVYSWTCTWYAEHDAESTLCFYATDYRHNLVGPGVAEATYGGAFFLFPPRHIFDIWQDPRLAFVEGLEDRLLAGAFFNTSEKHVAVVSPCPPKARWRRLARLFGRKIVHLPLQRFSQRTLARLRRFHVLNGKRVRTYAADYLRDL